MDIPINAEVLCDDGAYGHSTRVILNPTAEVVTHLAVKESTASLIRLNASKSDLEKLPPVTITEYLQPMLPFNLYGIDQYLM